MMLSKYMNKKIISLNVIHCKQIAPTMLKYVILDENTDSLHWVTTKIHHSNNFYFSCDCKKWLNNFHKNIRGDCSHIIYMKMKLGVIDER